LVHYRVHKSPLLVPILSQVNPVQNIPSHLRSILLLSTHLRLSFPSCLFSLTSPPIFYMQSSFPKSCHVSWPSDTPSLDHSSYAWRRVHVTKLLTMHVSPTSCHFIALLSKYSPHGHVLRHAVYIPPLTLEIKFRTHTKPQQHYIFVYSNFYFFRQKTKCSEVNSTKHYLNSIQHHLHQ
jgi:hypothetical protein